MCQVGRRSVTGRTFCLEERNRGWGWLACSTTGKYLLTDDHTHTGDVPLSSQYGSIFLVQLLYYTSTVELDEPKRSEGPLSLSLSYRAQLKTQKHHKETKTKQMGKRLKPDSLSLGRSGGLSKLGGEVPVYISS